MTDREIIQAFGGAAAVARLLGIKPPAIAYWKRKGIPPLRKIQLQTLKPELFNEANLSAIQPTPEATGN